MTTTKPPFLYWIIGALALIWNGLGILAYLTKAFITRDMIDALPQEQQAEYLVNYPACYTAVFAIAVFAGFFGSLTFLIRKKFAYILFLVSALCAIIQHIYIFMNIEVKSFIMPILVLVVCVFLVVYTKFGINKNWID